MRAEWQDRKAGPKRKGDSQPQKNNWGNKNKKMEETTAGKENGHPQKRATIMELEDGMLVGKDH